MVRALVTLIWMLAAMCSYAADQATGDTATYKYPGLAQTPPMGWNSWNTFGCKIDESLIRETANAMVSSGLRDAGYVYVNIDDCWHGERDAQGFIQPDAKRFPSGMKALADSVHQKGLKLGLYSDAGSKTCAGHPGSQGHEYQDAAQYAQWGIDYLKYDWCNTEERNPVEAYRTMAQALKAAGRPIVFSVCEWGDSKPWVWAPPLAHLWRTTGDITNCWDCVISHGSWNSYGVLRILDKQEGLRKFAGPGRWNDPDMMEVGNLASAGESRAHFAMWAMLAAPLIAGNDVRNMSDDTRSILTNKEVIAVDQDVLGVPAFAYKKEGDVEFWFRPLAEGAWAMAVLNRGAEVRQVTFDWTKEDVEDTQSHLRLDLPGAVYRLRDLFERAVMGSTNKPLKIKVPAHDIIIYRLDR